MNRNGCIYNKIICFQKWVQFYHKKTKKTRKNWAGKYMRICEYINLALQTEDTMSATSLPVSGRKKCNTNLCYTEDLRSSSADCRTMAEILSPDTNFYFCHNIVYL